MAGNVPASILKDLHAIVATSHAALEQGVDGDLKQVRAHLMEAQIAVQAVLEACTLALRTEEQARIKQNSRAGHVRIPNVGLPPV